MAVLNPLQLQKEVTARTRKRRKINGVCNTVEIRSYHTLQKGAFQKKWLESSRCRSP